VFGCKFQIALDITLGIDDGGCAGLLVTDQVRSVREAIEIELLDDHVSLGLVEWRNNIILWREYRGGCDAPLVLNNLTLS